MSDSLFEKGSLLKKHLLPNSPLILLLSKIYHVLFSGTCDQPFIISYGNIFEAHPPHPSIN